MKKLVIFMIALGIIISMLCGCGTTTPAEELTVGSDLTTPVPETQVSETEVQSFTFDEIPEAEPTEEVLSYAQVEKTKEELGNIVYYELNIGFDIYGILVEFSEDGKTCLVTGPQEGFEVNAMFPSLEFLETHEVIFQYDGVNAIERFDPPTYENSAYEDYFESFRYVHEADLKTHAGIQGFSEGTLTITVDETYTIIVNPK